MRFSARILVGIAMGLLGLAMVPTPSQAIMTLTPAGAADGFLLTTFAIVDPGNTGCCTGPWGIAVASNGNIIVDNPADGKRYVWPDVDGQTIPTALTNQPSNSWPTAYATAGGKPYGTDG